MGHGHAQDGVGGLSWIGGEAQGGTTHRTTHYLLSYSTPVHKVNWYAVSRESPRHLACICCR